MYKSRVFRFTRKFFKDREFDRNIFYVMSLVTMVASLSGLYIGPVFDNKVTTICTGILSVIYLILIYIFYKNKKYKFGNRFIVALTGFCLFPTIFFTTYGINSAFPLYMLLIPAAYGVITRKYYDFILPALNLILYLIQLHFSFYSKELHEINLVPYLIGFAVSYSLILAITSYLSISTRTLNKKLVEASTVDELTQVYNRRCFDENFRAYNYKVAAMFDIDDFKQVNDVFGHQAGDIVLADFAHLLKSCSSDEFRVYRWGGEEFVVLSKLDLQTSIRQVERIFDKIRNELKAPDGKNVTVSCGISESQKYRLMKAVDENLYAAKNSGKNKLVFNSQVIY